MINNVFAKQPIDLSIKILSDIAVCTLEALGEREKAKRAKKIGKALKKVIKNTEKMIIH